MELLARVSSQLRRYHKFLNIIDQKQENTHKYIVGGLELDIDTKEVIIDGKIVKVTPIELKILELLMEGVSPQWSLQTVWGVGYKIEKQANHE